MGCVEYVIRHPVRNEPVTLELASHDWLTEQLGAFLLVNFEEVAAKCLFRGV